MKNKAIFYLFALLMLPILSACSGRYRDGFINYNYGMSGIYSACGVTANGYAKTLLTFSGNTFTTSTTVYSDTDCKGNLVSSSSGAGTYINDSKTINYMFNDGTKIYDIYLFSGTTMFVGDRTGTLNGMTPETRPNAYSSSLVFHFIPDNTIRPYYSPYNYPPGYRN